MHEFVMQAPAKQRRKRSTARPRPSSSRHPTPRSREKQNWLNCLPSSTQTQDPDLNARGMSSHIQRWPPPARPRMRAFLRFGNAFPSKGTQSRQVYRCKFAFARWPNSPRLPSSTSDDCTRRDNPESWTADAPRPSPPDASSPCRPLSTFRRDAHADAPVPDETGRW